MHLLLPLLLWACSAPAWSCSCAPTSLARLYAQTDNVFRARITGGEVLPRTELGGDAVRMRFELLDHFKGKLPFDALNSTGLGGACGVSLQVGMEYLVFVANDGRVSTCSGTQAIGGEGGRFGRASLALLERHRRGELTQLVDPWVFSTYADRCLLRTQVDFAYRSSPATLEVGFQGPESMSRARLTLSLPGQRLDPAAAPLTLQVGSARWQVPWSGSVSRGAGSFALEGERVLSFMSSLLETTTVRLHFADPERGVVARELWTGHAREPLERFRACVLAARRGGARAGD